jgi:hypothetical protein
MLIYIYWGKENPLLGLPRKQYDGRSKAQVVEADYPF